METKKIFIVTGTLLLIWAVGSAAASWNFNRQNHVPKNPNMEIVDGTHKFENGSHTFSGIINLPTPCHQISYDATITESYPQQIMLDFSITNLSEFCAQVITAVPFEITVLADENASLAVRANNEPVNAAFKEVQPRSAQAPYSEDPDENI